MLNSRNVFLEAIKTFPKWMEIRKRPDTSFGGQYLKSIIQELDAIQQSIIDYKKDYFIVNYIGREDQLIDYLWAAHIGDVQFNSLSLVSPEIKLTDSVQDFYSDSGLALYNDGHLFFRLEALADEQKVTYKIGEFTYVLEAQKVHIWNILDEFALFAGIKRYENETNKQLLKRTLAALYNSTNATEDGLKNAITNAVSTYVELTPEEIKIEKLNNDNIFLTYDGINTIYDHIASINRDTWKTKQWDVGDWENSFKTMLYAPHQWDTPIPVKQNGIGYNDSLQVRMMTQDMHDTTDVEVCVYEKSDVKINEYIRKNKIEVPVTLELKKYNNTLKPVNVQYKISATEAEEVTNSNIKINCCKKLSGVAEQYIEDLIINNAEVANITIDRSILAGGKKYRLRFYPRSPYSDMAISYCLLEDGDNIQSLLHETGPYKFSASGGITNTDVKLHATSIQKAVYANNIVDVVGGFTLKNAGEKGIVKFDVSGMGNKQLYISSSCKETVIAHDTDFMRYTGFKFDGNRLVSTNDPQNVVTIELECTTFGFEIENGSAQIQKYIDGVQLPAMLMHAGATERLKFDKPTKVKYVITRLGMDQLAIKNIAYSSYEIKLYTEQGAVVNSASGLALPDYASNALYVEITTNTAFAPVVHYLHIDKILNNDSYTIDVPTFTGASARLDIATNCRTELIEVSGTKEIVLNADYCTKKLYKNMTNAPVYIKLNTSIFSEIRSSTPAIERVSYNGKTESFITLMPGESRDKITIDGTSLILLEVVDLKKKLIGNNSDKKIYVSRNIDGFIVQDGSGQERLITLTKDSITSTEAEIFTLVNLPAGLSGKFVIDKTQNAVIIADTVDKNFELLTLHPKNAGDYIAYNEVKTVRNTVDNVEIIDVFSPLLPNGRLMVFKIETVNTDSGTNAQALFIKQDDISDVWSLGKKNIKIIADIDFYSVQSYDLDTTSFNANFAASSIILLDRLQLVGGTEIDLAEYIISTSDQFGITYADEYCEETIIVEDDGFNKLKYTNVNNVTVRNVDSTKYDVLGKEGILVWKDSTLFGQQVTVQYIYKVPQQIYFNSVDVIYDLVGYTTEAYKRADGYPKMFYGLSDGDQIVLDKPAGKITAVCKNHNFFAVVTNSTVRVARYGSSESLYVKSGYYYYGNKEYYMYNKTSTDKIERAGNVELFNTKKINNSLITAQKSTNYLPDSAMLPRRTDITCIVDFANSKVAGISRANALSTCENVNNWLMFNMDVSFVKATNGLGVKFTPRGVNSYAMFEITQYLTDDTFVSVATTDSAPIYLAKEIKYTDMSYGKSVFAAVEREFVKDGSQATCRITRDTSQDDARYYILTTGGTIDDIIIKSYDGTETYSSLHVKTIEKLGFVVEEAPRKNTTVTLLFDTIGGLQNGTDVAKDDTICVATTVDWGITKIYDVRDKWNTCTLYNVDFVKDHAESSQHGWIETEPIPLKDLSSLKNIIVKVNDVLLPSMTGFDIAVYTADSTGGKYVLTHSKQDINTASVIKAKLSNYIKVRVEMPPGKTVNSIEVYACYTETATPLYTVQLPNGEFVSKVFDIGMQANYLLKKVVVDAISEPNDTLISIRGLREDDKNLVWTGWKNIITNNFMNVISEVRFENYRYFQLAIKLRNRAASVKINSLVFEVV